MKKEFDSVLVYAFLKWIKRDLDNGNIKDARDGAEFLKRELDTYLD